jgi:hypothetical protein
MTKPNLADIRRARRYVLRDLLPEVVRNYDGNLEAFAVALALVNKDDERLIYPQPRHISCPLDMSDHSQKKALTEGLRLCAWEMGAVGMIFVTDGVFRGSEQDYPALLVHMEHREGDTTWIAPIEGRNVGAFKRAEDLPWRGCVCCIDRVLPERWAN